MRINPFHRRHKTEVAKLVVNRLDTSSSSARLKDLVGNNQSMYFALQNFLLASPERQIPQLGEVKSHIAKGDLARADGSNMVARMEYETAAKIEIYKQNKESARNCLVLAEGVSEKEHHGFQETMLSDMDEVLRISKAYQIFAAPTIR